MSGPRWGLAALWMASVVAGTVADVPTPGAARTIGGYHVLAADFHVHSFPSTWSTLSPWDTVIDARHQRLARATPSCTDEIGSSAIRR